MTPAAAAPIGVLPPPGTNIEAQPLCLAFVRSLERLGATWKEMADTVTEGPFSAVVSFDPGSAVARRVRRLSLPLDRRSLVVLEPLVTCPSWELPSVSGAYGKRFVGSPLWRRLPNDIAFRWPQDLTASVAQGPWTYDCTMVAAEKRSAIAGSLYSLRRRVVLEANRTAFSLAVAGPNWASDSWRRHAMGLRAVAKALKAGRSPSLREALGWSSASPDHYLGVIESKADAIGLAPLSIVIENSGDYVSEKIVDAVRFGAVPIYVGPRLSNFDLPDAIAVRVPPDPRVIVERARALSPLGAEDVRSAGAEWLESPQAHAHATSSVMSGIARVVVNSLSLQIP